MSVQALRTFALRDGVMSGVVLTAAAYALFSGQDAMIKLLVAGFSVWQVLFFRSVTIVACCMAVGGPKVVGQSVRSPIVKPMLLRSFVILAAWLCFYTASRDMQFAELTTIYFVAPVIVLLLALVLLGEKVPPARWLAVLTGFAGVYVACDPASLGFAEPVILVLAAAFLWALAIVLLRKLALGERTLIQLVLNNGFFLAIAGVAQFFVWRMPAPADLVLLVASGLIGGAGQFMLFEGMKRAPVSVVAPFEYTSLIWAFVLGFLIWGDVPRHEVFLGAMLIACAGLIIVASERMARRRPCADHSTGGAAASSTSRRRV